MMGLVCVLVITGWTISAAGILICVYLQLVHIGADEFWFKYLWGVLLVYFLFSSADAAGQLTVPRPVITIITLALALLYFIAPGYLPGFDLEITLCAFYTCAVLWVC